MHEKGPLLINTVIGSNENIYFDILKRALELMDVQVHTMTFEQLVASDTAREILQKHTHVFLSGNGGNGPHFMNVPGVKQAYAWIAKFEGNILAICRGHQILGDQYGAVLEAGIYPEKGVVKVAKLSEEKILRGLSPVFDIWADHKDGITVPKSFSHIASSETCPVLMIKSLQRNHFGIQDHPEILDDSKQILVNFLEL